MKKTAFLIITCIFIISLAAGAAVKIGAEPLSGSTSGIIDIRLNGTRVDLNSIKLTETEKKQEVELWEEEDGIHYRLSTAEKAIYNLQLRVAGDALNTSAFAGKKLTHDFSLFAFNDDMEICADIFIQYEENEEGGTADIRVETAYKSNHFQLKQSESHEKRFPLSPKCNTEMAIL